MRMLHLLREEWFRSLSCYLEQMDAAVERNCRMSPSAPSHSASEGLSRAFMGHIYDIDVQLSAVLKQVHWVRLSSVLLLVPRPMPGNGPVS